MMILLPLLQRMVTTLVVVMVTGIVGNMGITCTLMSDSGSAQMANESFSLDARLHFNTEGKSSNA